MKRVKILTITLGIIAITMIAFWGVYIPVQNRMENQIKENIYAMDLKGSRNIRFKVNTESKTNVKDAEGKVVEDADNLTEEEMKEKGYTKEEIPNNSEDIKKVENYKICQNIMEKRLKKLGAQSYSIKLDEQTGDIIIELPETSQTDSIISNLNTIGNFQIADSQTNEIFMDNHTIKQARVMYGSGNDTTSKGTSVYLDIVFNKEGTKKLEEISEKYKKSENTTSSENTQNENTTTSENQTDVDTEAEENTEKKITMKIDDQEVMSTSFEEPIRTGRLQLSIGSNTSDTDTLQDYIEQASNMANVLDTGSLPIKYDLSENQYILTEITDDAMQIVIYIVLGIIVVSLLIWMIRYKSIGVLGAISYIGYIALLTLIIRYTNVIVSIESLLAMAIVLIFNYIFVNKLLVKFEHIAETYQEFFIKMVPVILMTITFCFINWIPISSFGMVMFWGIVLMAIYNGVITNSLLKINTRKEK